jgi:hypothetical protein
MIDVLFLFLLFPLMAIIAKHLVTLETLMSNTQTISIPVNCDIDPSQLLEIAQALIEDLEDAIDDAGFHCEIDEQDVCVEWK